MSLFSKASFAALMGASLLTMTAANASAHIVCNADGDCWHTKTTYEYRPEFGVTIHPTIGNGKKANTMPGASTRVAAIGMAANGRTSDRPPAQRAPG
jgi:hypothetical protein